MLITRRERTGNNKTNKNEDFIYLVNPYTKGNRMSLFTQDSLGLYLLS